MTNQVKTDSANSPVRPHFWQRLAPFLDVIGAVLIFGSWIFSHTLSQRAVDQANTHQSIISRFRQFRLYDEFAHRISGIQSDLVRTRNLVELATQNRISSDSKAGSNSEPLTWTGMSATQIRELNDFVHDLANYAGQLGSSEIIRQCEYLSWALYIIGTLIILFGRAKGVLSAKTKQPD